MIRRFFSKLWFKILFDRFKWYRWWYGGRWECWYVDPCKSMIWHDIKKDEQGYQNRPPCCFGTPISEEYPYKDNA